MAWPPQSPDLNIMESVWDYMNRRKQLRHGNPQKSCGNFSKMLEIFYLPSILKKCVSISPYIHSALKHCASTITLQLPWTPCPPSSKDIHVNGMLVA